ncbi:hypothetical protein [Halococcus saccharolyticus]|uniref:Uncharacterized protein n=1 Tax=Halococcus saccharolyticus DSM 5350 TaxID=1227455 RepID=M0MT76_9EURY|nr:hypothetical protein [Halococcus saccharolyticus]EMA47944.1 hypothetical protein C449_00690 [Halococcus saccharolyticus DSM 5350]
MSDKTLRRSLQSVFERGPVSERTERERVGPLDETVEARPGGHNGQRITLATAGEPGQPVSDGGKGQWLSGWAVPPEGIKTGSGGEAE